MQSHLIKSDESVSSACKDILKGEWLKANNTCEIDSKDCIDALDNKTVYDNLFVMDLGAIFWNVSAEVLIRDLECHSCPTCKNDDFKDDDDDDDNGGGGGGGGGGGDSDDSASGNLATKLGIMIPFFIITFYFF